jgi:hypothetical protein
VAYLEQVKETVVTPPNLTFDKTMTLIRGGREIRILYLGRGTHGHRRRRLPAEGADSSAAAT